MADTTRVRCGRCQDTLMAGSNYCLACGYDNGDALTKQVNLVQRANDRIERAKILGKLFRFCRFLGLGRYLR